MLQSRIGIINVGTCVIAFVMCEGELDEMSSVGVVQLHHLERPMLRLCDGSEYM